MKFDIRFGMKHGGWLFPNAAVFVIKKVTQEQFDLGLSAVNAVKSFLGTIAPNLVQYVVYEKRG